MHPLQGADLISLRLLRHPYISIDQNNFPNYFNLYPFLDNNFSTTSVFTTIFNLQNYSSWSNHGFPIL